LLFNKKTRKSSIRVCLRISNEGTSIAVSQLKSNKLTLQRCVNFSAYEISQTPNLIQSYIEQEKLSGESASIILDSADYQVLLTEMPEVSEDEICDALWWKVKDLVAFEVENAQVDYIELPEDSAKHQGRKVYAVIADKCKVAAKVSLVEELGLNPVLVEVPETALLHLVSNLCSDLVGTSILYMDPEQSLLLLLSEGNMYLSRTLQYNYFDRLEAVALDLQRSMDYYESQIGKPPCTKVVVLPLQNDDSEIMQVLRANVGAEITSIDLNEIVNAKDTLNIDVQENCLLAISGAMHADKKAK